MAFPNSSRPALNFPTVLGLISWVGWSITLLPPQSRTFSSMFYLYWSPTGTWIGGVICSSGVSTHFLSIEIWKTGWIRAQPEDQVCMQQHQFVSALDMDQITSERVCGCVANEGKLHVWPAQKTNHPLPTTNPLYEHHHTILYES